MVYNAITKPLNICLCRQLMLWMSDSVFKGELNPKIKLDLNDSFCTLINKYNPHIF